MFICSIFDTFFKGVDIVLQVIIGLIIVGAVLGIIGGIVSVIASHNKSKRNKKSSWDLSETDNTINALYVKPQNDTYYKMKSNIMTDGEKILLRYLERIIDPNKYLIIPQVHYDRYLEVNTERDEKYQAISASMINTRSSDFGIETKNHEPVCYIEYDDGTHNEADRKKRDYFLTKACEKVGLPRVVISSKEFNSQVIKSKGTVGICKTLYKKLFNASGNPLNLPPLLCPQCRKEFNLMTGDYGAFLSHGVNSSCDNVNIFRK